MLMLAALVIVMVFFGVGVDGGFTGVLERLESQDGNLVTPLNPTRALWHSPWAIIAVFVAHIPLGLLPHLGNKLWALKEVNQQKTSIKLASVFGHVHRFARGKDYDTTDSSRSSAAGHVFNGHDVGPERDSKICLRRR